MNIGREVRMTKYSQEDIRKAGFEKTDRGYKIGVRCGGCTRECELYYTHHDDTEVECGLDGVKAYAIELLISGFSCNRRYNVISANDAYVEYVENPDYMNNPKFHTYCRVIKKEV